MNKNILADKLELANFINQVKLKLPWLLLFLFIGLSSGYLVSKYKKQVFSAKATIKIDDKSSNVTDFLAIDMFSESFNQYNKILTEARIISSRTMIEKALEKLPLDVRYYKKGRFSSYELYRKSPINLNLLSASDEITPLEIDLEFKDENHFIISYEKNGIRDTSINLTYNQPFKIFEESYSIDRVYSEPLKSIETDGSYVIKVVDKVKLAQEFAKQLTVTQVEEKVALLSIVYQSSNPLLCKDFVDALVSSYSNVEFELKALAASNTIRFIDERLDQLSSTMNEVEDQITQFKQDKRIIDFESVERIESERLIDLESSKRIAELRILNFNIVENELNQGKKLSEISINAEGNMDPTLNQLITAFNNLKIQKATLGVNFTIDSKKARELDSQIIETINSIRESIKLSKSAVEKEIEYLDSKIEILNSRYNIFPEDQQDYFHLIRDFEVNQKVVSFLMEKKIEASIANASLIPDIQVIDLPILPEEPISISTLNIYLLSVFLSLLIGTSIILIFVFLNDRIYDKVILETTTDIPVLGTLTVSNSNEFESVEEIIGTERTIFKESVNALRTNLRFLPNSSKAQVVSVTSTVSQEGKSFMLINLATSLTLLGKTVVVIDLDMRKPKIQNYFDKDNKKLGASLYLSGKATLEEAVVNSHIPNLDVILSGPIPPNPMELIQSDKFHEMIAKLKENYDYIMIDNPPIGIVADAIFVLKNSDINLFVVRSGFSRIGFLDTAINAKEKNKIPNLYFVLNGVNKTSSGYYKNYSQGYYTDQSPKQGMWFKKS
ncbi:MAG: hypothetical protein DWP98_11585 [Bacteroidetes bacterium]|nr:MAG: hypothetical protein DWP98_11585 [Bacteroidota bacterium]MBL1144024.1 polysaccharide biosynthesis tyrosine autokinase [Bacteroidota bacterium]NOG56824.1 polysaccharide biosynthesis tyrosine autokinase [Bacteroidota bacterium]